MPCGLVRGQTVLPSIGKTQAVSASLLKRCDAQTQAQLLAMLDQVRSSLEALGDGCNGGGDCGQSGRR